jgi:hypothetical protein
MVDATEQFRDAFDPPAAPSRSVGRRRRRLSASVCPTGVRLEARIDKLSSRIDEVIRGASTTRTVILAAIVASVVRGLGALWVTEANLLAAFQAGIAIHEMKP